MFLENGKSKDEAAELAYITGVAANFVSGIIEYLGSFVGRALVAKLPRLALLTPLAGIAISWLTLENMIGIFKKPVVALWPFMIVMCYFNGVKFGPIPVALLAIVVGSLVAWMSGEMSSDNVGESASNVGFGLSFPLADIFSNLDSIQPYISIIIPVSITNFLGTIECTESAALAGDHYPLGESMRADGLGSIVGALFGSPFGTTVYIGHAAYKQMGGRRGYSLLNGAVCCFAFLTALAAPVFSIIAREAVEPVIVFVGLMIACQTVEISNKRYYPAFFLGLVPPLCDFAMTKINDAVESYGRYADDCLKKVPGK